MILRLTVLVSVLVGVTQLTRGDEVAINKLTPVPFTDVRIQDEFWAPRLKINREKTIPHAFRMCEETGRIDNFSKASGLMKGEFRGIFFDDSDVYKNIEAASYTLATERDPKLDAYLDALIVKIAAAQRPDGYLNSYYTTKGGLENRWSNLKDMHELYCSGHLIEAAVAHFRATGKRNLLNVAIKLADHIDSVFGPGKRHGTSGHEEIELALVKLYHLTGENRYLKLANFFLDERGNSKDRKIWGEYHQDHMPVTQQTTPVGHAVRATYLYCGMADVAAARGNQAYIAALGRIWDSLILRKMYITGGIGSRHSGEAFGDDYELPNDSAYAETCAAIGNALWNQRMFLLHADGRYADIVEKIIYNGMLSGVSLSGDRFFYVNPLASRGSHHRQAWYGCACCPVNITRILPSLPGYVYATDPSSLYVNLYAAGTGAATVKGTRIALGQETRYPWDGQIRLKIDPAQTVEFELKLRIPGWCDTASLKINGQKVDRLEMDKGYARVSRRWKSGDVVDLDLPMVIRRVKANAQVKADEGRVALQRGPIVYCLEAVDNGGRVYNLSLPADSRLRAEHRADLLGGVTVITGKALSRKVGGAIEPVEFTAIPYYAWDNREAGQMAVWIPEDPKLDEPAPIPTPASMSKVSASHRWQLDTLEALNDQVEPANSSDQNLPRFSWWDHKGTEEWVQYDLKSPQSVREVGVYWFDDGVTGGGCRVPASWQVLYKDGDAWKPVNNATAAGTALDRYNKVIFDPVTTPALRLAVKLRAGFSAGILEWKVK